MSLKFILLGCGSSMGVPRPDGFWGKCNPKESKNYRTRCSALISSNNLNILIDTSPDLRIQLIKQRIKNIHNIIYSHLHADQTHGINDLRVFYLKIRIDPKILHLNHFLVVKNLNIYLVKLSEYDFFIIFLSLGTIISNSILFLFAYSIANSLVENSSFNSFKVSVELSHPIKGSVPGSFV